MIGQLCACHIAVLVLDVMQQFALPQRKMDIYHKNLLKNFLMVEEIIIYLSLS
ncbi:Uncharacterised protein [uncultured Blautia sp.]|nr:Uncharacterised protein [uncultured Blautia sp.]